MLICDDLLKSKKNVCTTLMPLPLAKYIRIALTFNLLPWQSIEIMYLPSLMALGQSFFESSVAQGVGEQHA